MRKINKYTVGMSKCYYGRIIRIASSSSDTIVDFGTAVKFGLRRGRLVGSGRMVVDSVVLVMMGTSSSAARLVPVCMPK